MGEVTLFGQNTAFCFNIYMAPLSLSVAHVFLTCPTDPFSVQITACQSQDFICILVKSKLSFFFFLFFMSLCLAFAQLCVSVGHQPSTVIFIAALPALPVKVGET